MFPLRPAYVSILAHITTTAPTVNHCNWFFLSVSPWYTAWSFSLCSNACSKLYVHFSCLVDPINTLDHVMKTNTASCKHITVSLKNTSYCIIQHIRQSQNAESKKPAFNKPRCLPLPFLLTPTLYQHAIFTQDMGLHKMMLASGFWFLCFLLDLSLINITRPLENLSIKLSLMINGSRVNRRRGICKWLCLWCAVWSPVRYHMGGLSMSWIQKRGSSVWKGFLGVCAHASMLQWELAVQLMQAVVPSKESVK